MKNHPLVGGNKRLGWLATAVFLEINGVPVQAANDDVYDPVPGVGDGPSGVEGIANRLRRIVGGGPEG